MKTEVRTIDADIASSILKKNPNNRKLSNNHVRFLAKQMTDGLWKFDGQPIRLDRYGRLLDGQHRLNAIVTSNTKQEFLIVTGLHEDTFKTMDTGKNRSAGDVLSIEGYKYHNELSFIAKFIINFDNGSRAQAGNGRISNSEVLSWVEKNPTLESVLRQAESFKDSFSNVLTRSFISSLILLFNRYNVIQSEDFMRRLCTGLDLEPNSPIFILRKKLIADKISKSTLPRTEKLALIIKAWNFYRLDKKIKVLRWDKEKEDFPTIL